MAAIILLALLCADPVPEPSPKLLKILETSERLRGEQIHLLKTKYIKDAQLDLSGAKRGKINPRAVGIVVSTNGEPWTFPDQENKRRNIDECTAQIEQLKKRLSELENHTSVLFEALGGDDLQRGKIGNIGQCPVFRVIDAKSALIRFQWQTRIARNNAPAYESREVIVLLRGVDTSGMADGQMMDAPQLIEVVGNQSFETDSGKTTVFVFEPFDQTQLDPWRDQLAKFASKPVKKSTGRR